VTVLQESLGLKLDAERSPVEVVIIDAKLPSENYYPVAGIVGGRGPARDVLDSMVLAALTPHR
jgi:hypothetical protein